MGIDAILALAGFVVPPIFHLFKGWFMPDKTDDPESTMSTLATTKPEVLGPYVDSLARYTEAQVKFFNRDVAGVPSQWIIDLRASIRPICAAIGIVALVVEGLAVYNFNLPIGTRGLFAMSASSWLGGKIINGGSN